VLYSATLTDAEEVATSAALAELGVGGWRTLPHGSAEGSDVDRQELTRALRESIAELGATAVVIGAVDDRVLEAATGTAHEAGLPAFLTRTVRQAPGQRLIAIDVGDHVEQKLRALRHFSSRWHLTERTRTLTDGTTDIITETETFLRADAPRPAPAQHATEPARLSLGNRSLAGLGGLLLGVLFGVLGTIAHQATLTLFGVALPIGLMIAFVGIGALLVGLRLVVGDRFVVGLAAVGLLVTIFLLSLRGAGGSVLVPAGLPGTLWTVVPALLAALVLAWPKLPTRHR
jgi:hypothetical protein